MEAFEIRPATRRDLDPASALLTTAGLPLEGFAEHLKHALIATRRGTVVGVVELEIYGDSALLRSLAVTPAERGMGLGERLTGDALELARRRGTRDVYLLTQTAERFFPRFGFAAEDRSLAPAALQESEEFRTACPSSAVMMHVRV